MGTSSLYLFCPKLGRKVQNLSETFVPNFGPGHYALLKIGKFGVRRDPENLKSWLVRSQEVSLDLIVTTVLARAHIYGVLLDAHYVHRTY